MTQAELTIPMGSLLPDSTPIPVQESVNRLATNTLCLSLRKRVFGNSKSASLATARFTEPLEAGDTGEAPKEPDKNLLSLTKCILASPELSELCRHDGETTRLLRKRSFPSMFKSGIFLISIAEVEEIHLWLTEERAPQREILVQKAVAMYDQRCRETSDRLGVLHLPGDYPSKDEFAQSFGFEWQWITWDTPTRLKAISPAIFEAERQKAAGLFASVAEEGRMAMRRMLLDLGLKLRTALTPTDDGKKRRLGKGSIENLTEFLAVFEKRNVAGDTDLADVVQQTRAIMLGVDRETLKDENIRTKVGQDLDAVVASLEVLTGGGRAISFSEEIV